MRIQGHCQRSISSHFKLLAEKSILHKTPGNSSSFSQLGRTCSSSASQVWSTVFLDVNGIFGTHSLYQNETIFDLEARMHGYVN